MNIEGYLEAVDRIMPSLASLNEAVFATPELGFEEVESSRAHVDALRAAGFEVEYPYMGMPTAFRAEYRGSAPGPSVTGPSVAGPSVAFLAEYDALPGIGHGCAHNLLGTASTGAGIALSSRIDAIGGSVVVFGTPAEETSGAKVAMAEGGAFDGLDAAVVAHPAEEHYRSGSSLALSAMQFEFIGKASHAGSSPELGVNALNGVIGLFNAVNAMRGHIRSDSRIHGIISEGGVAANIVPERAVARFYVRSPAKAYIATLETMMRACATSAAEAVGAEVRITNYEASYDDLLTNGALSGAYEGNLLSAGVPRVMAPRSSFGSLDVGNVSYRCPAIHPYFKISETPIVAHTREFAAASVTPYALSSLRLVVAAMAKTGADVIEDSGLRASIRNEFEEATKGLVKAAHA